jgi:hypothetical protein
MTKPALSLLCALAFAPVVYAQSAPTPSAPEAAATPPPPARVRAWFVPGGEKGEVTLRVRSADQEAPVPLGSTTDGALSTPPSYEDRPAGSVAFELVDGDERVLASTNVALRGKLHYTLLASQAAGKWSITSFTDAIAPNAADRPLRVLNFARGRETVLQLSSDKIERVPGDSAKELRLPAKINGYQVKVLAPDGGPPAESSGEIDLVEYPLAYLLVAPDRRERMRPQLITGGAPKEPAPTPPPVVAKFDPAEERIKEREARINAARLDRDHIAAQMAILKAQIEEGVNVPENADELKRELEKQLKEVQSELNRPAGAAAAPVATPPAAN